MTLDSFRCSSRFCLISDAPQVSAHVLLFCLLFFDEFFLCVEVSTAVESTAIGGSRLYPADYLHAIGCFTTNTDSGVARNTLPFSSFPIYNYIKRPVQKAFLPGMAGCIEHATMVAEMLKDAKERQRQLCTIWLDLANAYGSVRHSMVYLLSNGTTSRRT